MKKFLTALTIFVLAPSFAFAAIAFDSTASRSNSSGTTNDSTFTNTAGNFMYVSGRANLSTGLSGLTVSGTYGGVALTPVAVVVYDSNTFAEFGLYLQNPPTGSNALDVTFNDSLDASYVYAETFSGANGGLDNYATVNGTTNGSSQITGNISVGATGSWVAIGYSSSEGLTSVKNGLTSYDIREGLSSGVAIADSNGTVSTGSNTITFTDSLSSIPAGIVMVSISPTAATTPKIAGYFNSFWW